MLGSVHGFDFRLKSLFLSVDGAETQIGTNIYI